MPLEMAPMKKDTMSASRLTAKTAKNVRATNVDVVDPIHKTTSFKDDSSEVVLLF